MKKFWKDVINNSILLFGARITAKLATVGVMIIVARILGADSFGILSAVLALSLFAGLVSDFGMVLPTIRAISRNVDETQSILEGTFTIRILGAGIGIVIVCIGGMWLKLPIHLVIILAISSVVESLATAVARSFEGRQEIKVLTSYVIYERFIFATVLISSALEFHSVQSIVIAHLVAYTISLSVAVWMFHTRIGALTLTFSFARLESYVRTGMPLLLTSLVSTLFYKADILLLSHYRASTETGLYNAAYRLIDAQMFIPMTIMVSIFPALTKMHHEHNGEFFRVFNRSFVLLAAIGIAIMLVLVLGGPSLIHLLYTDEYAGSVRALEVLSLMIPFYFVNYLLTQSLVAIHQEALFSKIMIVAAVVSVCLNVVVVPSFGYVGSAWIRVAGEILSFVSFLVAFRVKSRVMLSTRDANQSTAMVYD